MEQTLSRSNGLRPDLKFWLIDWVENERDDVSPARKQADEARIYRYLVPYLGRRSARNLTSEDIEDWIQTLQDDGVGDATIHASLLALRGALNHAMDTGLIRENPAKGVQVKGLQALRVPEPREILTEKQLKRLVKETDPWYQPLVLFAARTGAKWEETIGLRIQDVHLGRGLVTLGLMRATEVGGHVQYTEGTAKDARLVEMTPDLTECLRDFIRETAEWRTDDFPFVFMTKRDHVHPLRPNFNTFVLKPAVEAAGLDSEITFHSLRHTAAVRMIRDGQKIEDVARAMGHRSPVTTRRTYIDYIRERA